MIDDAIQQLEQGESLSEATMTEVMDELMEGNPSDSKVASLLTALHQKGETVDELVGAARSLRRHMRPIQSRRERVVDTCGTGGSGLGTFNISTVAAIVAASAGASVAKHGNRASSGKSGSADVLQELGVNIECSLQTVERCLNQLGICFCYAPLFHPSVARVAKVRKKLGHPTIFNLVGPLCNPANAPYQLLGAGRAETREKLASALAQLGVQRALVVHGQEGMGEVSNSGLTDVSEVRDGRIAHRTIQSSDFGIEPSNSIELKAVDTADSADKIRRILDGQRGAARDVTVINAAAALWISGISEDLRLAADRCERAIDNGQAREMLAELVEMTNRGG